MPKADDFDEFYATTSRRLVGQLFAMTGDLHEAQDAVQEAYIRAWLRWPRIQGYHDREAWIRTVGPCGKPKRKKRGTHSPPFSIYTACGGLPQDPGRAP
jgi:predicted RNA polymerase sigma factor